MKNPKINLFTIGDSTDINTWSALPYFFSRALLAQKVQLARFNLEPRESRLFLCAQHLWNRKVRRRWFLHTRTYHLLALRKLAAVSRAHGNADLNLFLTFSFSSYRYVDVPVAHYCDRTLEHHLEEAGVRPTHTDRFLIEIERNNLAHARYVFCINQLCREFIESRYGINGIMQLGVGINMEEDKSTSPEELVARKEASKDILFIARGYRQRGADILAQAFRLFNARHNNEFLLHLVGILPEEMEQSDERIRCYGYLDKNKPGDRETYWKLLASARLFVFPTRPAPVSGVIREAHWMCTPIIMTKIPGAAERVEHGQNGILVDSFEPAEFAHQMDALVRDRDRWRTMALNARESVRLHTWDHTARRFLELVASDGIGISGPQCYEESLA